MVLSDITSEVQSRILRTETARAVVCANIIFRDIANRANEVSVVIDALKTASTNAIVADDYYVSLPTDFLSLYSDPVLEYDTDDGYQLIKRDKEWFDANYPQLSAETTTSKPKYFTIDQNRCLFAPRNDGSYDLALPYMRLHPDVADDLTTIYYDDKFKECIILGTCYKRCLELNITDEITKYSQLYLEELQRLGIIDNRNSQMPLIVNYSD